MLSRYLILPARRNVYGDEIETCGFFAIELTPEWLKLLQARSLLFYGLRANDPDTTHVEFLDSASVFYHENDLAEICEDWWDDWIGEDFVITDKALPDPTLHAARMESTYLSVASRGMWIHGYPKYWSHVESNWFELPRLLNVLAGIP